MIDKLGEAGYVPATDASRLALLNPATVSRYLIVGHVRGLIVAGRRYAHWESFLAHMGGPPVAEALGLPEHAIDAVRRARKQLQAVKPKRATAS